MTKPSYIFWGVNEERVPVKRVRGPAVQGMVRVEILATVRGYREGSRMYVSWTRLEKC